MSTTSQTTTTDDAETLALLESLLDVHARGLLGISGSEFLAQLTAGAFDDVRGSIAPPEMTHLIQLGDVVLGNDTEEPAWSADERRAYFDSEVQRMLGMSGDEFLARLDAGEFDDWDDPNRPELMDIMMMLSLVR